MRTNPDGSPVFYVLEYVTISRDPRTNLVVAIGGEQRAAGILQTTGGFIESPGPRGPYHRLPHTMPVEQQRHHATAAAHALLLAGFGVHLDPELNTLGQPDGDRVAAHRYLEQLAERARTAATDREVAAILAEITAPTEGLLSHLVQTLISTWATWSQREDRPPAETDLAMQLMDLTSGISRHNDQIRHIRDQAAARPAPPTSPKPPTPPAGPARTR